MNKDRSQQFSGDLEIGRVRTTDWHEYLHAILQRLWAVILCVTLGALSAAYFLNEQQVRYQARSVLFIEQQQTQQTQVLGKVQGLRDDEVLSPEMINTVVDLLSGYPFAQRVATRLNLNKDPRFLAGLPGKFNHELSADEAASRLVQSVRVNYRAGTRLIDVFVTQKDTLTATTLANAYADEYIRFGMERRAEVNRAASSFLMEESARLRGELKISEEELQKFRERERSASLEKMQQNSEGKISELSNALSAVQIRISQLDNDLKDASVKTGDTQALLALPSVSTQPKVMELNQEISDAERQFTLLKQRYRSEHPAYVAAQTQINSLQQDRNKVLDDVVNLLKNERQRLQNQENELKKANEEEQTRLLSATGKSVEYNDLTRAVQTNKAMYDAILARIAEIDVTKGMNDAAVKIYERAIAAVPLKVGALDTYIRRIGIGLACGLGIALGLHFLDQSVKTIDEVEEITSIPVLTALPKKTTSGSPELDVVSNREGMIAEGFRSLRTSLAMSAHADKRKVFLFTSAQPSEGKTFSSTNFAATLSQQGLKTLLIDADLRRPMVSRVLFGESRKPGLTEVLSGRCALADAVIETKVADLLVLPAGSRVSNPAELLAKQEFRALVVEALTRYDRVVIDSAPVLAVSDSLLIAPHVDATCLVVRSFKTPRKTLRRAVKALDEIDCPPVGIVLNFLPSGAGSYYYYSGKYYGSYGEKGVYGT